MQKQTMATAGTPQLSFRKPALEDVAAVLELELASYPADESADEAKIKQRIEHASDFFRLCFLGSELVGFVNGTLVRGELTEESMSGHDNEGETLCIHSLVTKEAHRRKKIATQQMAQYLVHIGSCLEKYPALAAIELLAKEDKIKLYTNIGFTNLGDSGVDHGQDKWMRCCLKLSRS